jgi:hypothetical protein
MHISSFRHFGHFCVAPRFWCLTFWGKSAIKPPCKIPPEKGSFWGVQVGWGNPSEGPKGAKSAPGGQNGVSEAKNAPSTRARGLYTGGPDPFRPPIWGVPDPQEPQIRAPNRGAVWGGWGLCTPGGVLVHLGLVLGDLVLGRCKDNLREREGK